MPANATPRLAAPATETLVPCDVCGYGHGADTHNPLAHDEAGVPMPDDGEEVIVWCDTHHEEYGSGRCTRGRNCDPYQRPLSEVTEPDEQPRLIGEEG